MNSSHFQLTKWFMRYWSQQKMTFIGKYFTETCRFQLTNEFCPCAWVDSSFIKSLGITFGWNDNDKSYDTCHEFNLLFHAWELQHTGHLWSSSPLFFSNLTKSKTICYLAISDWNYQLSTYEWIIVFSAIWVKITIKREKKK